MTAQEPHGEERWLTPSRLLSLVAVVLAAYAALVILRALRSILLMLLVSLFLSFAMEPAVQHLARRGWRRGVATGAVFAVTALVLLGVVAAMIPPLVAQGSDLVRNLPRSVDNLSASLEALPFGFDVEPTPELRAELTEFANRLSDWAQDAALGAAGRVIDIGATAIGALLQLFTIGLVTFYLVADGPRARRALARPFPPERQRELLAMWELAVAKTGGYIYSRLLLAAVSAAAHALLLTVLGVPYAFVLALWVGVTSAFVPVVGTYLGGILAVVVAFINEPIDAVWVTGFLLVYQQIENYLLAPKVQARTMDVHPAIAFLSVLIGGTLLGAVGALLALPATAIIQALLSTYVQRHQLIAELAEVPLPDETRAPRPVRRHGLVARDRPPGPAPATEHPARDKETTP